MRKFYADRTRELSREVSFGRGWRAEKGPRWQACWLADTGEFVIVDAVADNFGIGSGDSIVGEILNVGFEGLLIGAGGLTDAPEVEILMLVDAEEDVQFFLAGWEDHEPEPWGITWLRRACADAIHGDSLAE